MNTVMSVANQEMRQVLDEDGAIVSPAQCMLWEESFPCSWPAFLAALERCCAARGWEIDYGSIEDHSCIIFACPACRSDELFAQQDFTDDELPF